MVEHEPLQVKYEYDAVKDERRVAFILNGSDWVYFSVEQAAKLAELLGKAARESGRRLLHARLENRDHREDRDGREHRPEGQEGPEPARPAEHAMVAHAT